MRLQRLSLAVSFAVLVTPVALAWPGPMSVRSYTRSDGMLRITIESSRDPSFKKQMTEQDWTELTVRLEKEARKQCRGEFTLSELEQKTATFSGLPSKNGNIFYVVASVSCNVQSN